ncbi:MAG: protein-glutamate O-methyltransferase CheR [Bacteroidetes bacterium]|jgi:chemotaxis protein methyltransferase CheR|nr:protein-glutamate O-methyltransferase CheR [Bacteroidota bacterium]MCL5035309.1 protein-glutamate O-methyltransferase CheR [Bacteroidota bacterium]
MSFTLPPNTLYPQGTKLSDETFQLLRKYIYERTGIFFADNKKYLLESRVGRRLSALRLESFPEYYSALLNGIGAGELPHLINSVTINETFFFRNDPQFIALETLILPELIKKRIEQGNYNIKIWSAASSTGEEPYTIALLIREKFQARYPAVKFEIVGTDINTQVLEVARRGAYKEYSIRNIPRLYMDKYFEPHGDQFILRDEIKKMVRFNQMNLFDRGMMKTMQNFDVVFAANVLIYFDFNSKQVVVSSIYDSLNKGGYFFVGYSETLYGLTQAFKPVHYDKAIAYRKE